MDWTPAQLPSGRHGLSREFVVNSQRSRLLGAAVVIAGAEGYAGMTVSAVIARAGVSRKTFYEFFQDREDIFLATFDQLLDRAVDGARDAYENGGESWPERLRALLEAGLGALAASPHEARLGFVEVLAAGPRALQRRDAALREFMQFLSPGYEAAGGDVPELMPEAIVGAVYEIVYARVLQARTADLPELLPQLMYVALAPFLGPQQARELAGANVASAASSGRRRSA
ncbi:TetR/AcrR family transcriptional regulator [Conexibacter sp. JD483]|uniref:TetR/AcrR family transcriptional regulator n=1 Tax=unclassified Conexibacter TaxID=2627773 RepID=UPI0027273B09|nr:MULTISPECIES: TetR/AcrR family transcriptional regulator [unclassified Conexibacter]MDO8185129.1 TetR/AcrR family transcriptional regulator [Conexibacter sp. CPCC 205706]MDO8196839.1 TetR/AcrR family transcriptional regulator [Conexibacter sp. CPCC 205762]MDR9368615.1 TetR/AcrR family transcriptional regulator [Conexibacter sp. JD483]